MLTTARIIAVRRELGLTQERLAHLLGVSFVTVNRWENGASGPTGLAAEVYRALDAALRSGRTPKQLLGDGSLDAGHLLHRIFANAYGK